MIEWWKTYVDRILHDATYFRRQVRSAIITASIGGYAVAEKLATLFYKPHPKLILAIQITTLLCIFIGIRMKMDPPKETPEQKADQVHAVLAARGVLPAPDGPVEIPLAPAVQEIRQGVSAP